MLLSMYASYLWARLDKKAYIPMITIFVILVSFFSAHFPASGVGLIIFFPFSFLSFPFYDFIDEVWVSPIYEVYVHRIRFFTVNIASPYSIAGWIDMQSITHFSLFLLVNVLGALLGYWVGKKFRIQFFSSKWWTVLSSFVGIISMGLGLLLVMRGPGYFVAENIGITLFGFGIFLLEAIFLSKTWREFMFACNILLGQD